jgi:formiminotetrahydrofolate cyclodeaminase
MPNTTKVLRQIVLVAILMVGAAAPLAVSAQSDLDASEAQAFLGNWNLQIMSDAGGGAMTLSITDQGGKVAVEMGSPDLGGSQEVTDVTKVGDSLRLAVQLDMQGQTFPIVMVLNTTDTGLSANVDVADGTFVATGTGTRAN